MPDERGKFYRDRTFRPSEHTCSPPRVTLASFEGRRAFCICGVVHERRQGFWVPVNA